MKPLLLQLHFWEGGNEKRRCLNWPGQSPDSTAPALKGSSPLCGASEGTMPRQGTGCQLLYGQEKVISRSPKPEFQFVQLPTCHGQLLKRPLLTGHWWTLEQTLQQCPSARWKLQESIFSSSVSTGQGGNPREAAAKGGRDRRDSFSSVHQGWCFNEFTDLTHLQRAAKSWMECAHPTQVPRGMYTANFKAQDKPGFWCSTRLQLWEPRGQRALWIHCHFKFKKNKKKVSTNISLGIINPFLGFFPEGQEKTLITTDIQKQEHNGMWGGKKSHQGEQVPMLLKLDIQHTSTT